MILLLSSCFVSNRLGQILDNNSGPNPAASPASDDPLTMPDDGTIIATLPTPPAEYFPPDSELSYNVAGACFAGQRVSSLVPGSGYQYPLRRGEVKVAAFLINIDTLTPQTLTRQRVNELVFTGNGQNPFSINSFVEKASGGVAHLTGNAFGPFTAHLDADKNISNKSQYCQDIVNQAKAAAVAQGFNEEDYPWNSIFLYMVPGSLLVCGSCGASIGGLNFAVVGGFVDLVYPNVQPNMGLNGYSNYAMVHEFGHALGLHHDSQMACTHDGTSVTIGDECVVNEYGDNFSAMGGSGSITMPAIYSAQGLAKMGWITPHLVTSSGIYEVSPIDRPVIGTIPQIIQIPRGLSIKSYYYVYRKIDLAGEVVPDPNGIFIQLSRSHTVGQFYTPALLKMHPSGGMNDVMLRIGETFTDPQTGIALTLNSINGSGVADISVLYPSRSAAKPSTPTGVTATVVGTDVSIVWDQSEDALGYGINEYQVTINDPVHPYNDVVSPHVLCAKDAGSGVYSGTVPSRSGCEQIKFTKGRLPNNVDLYIRVQSRDLSDNLSEPSAPLVVKIPYGPDITAPTAPTNVVATNVSTQGVTLSWSASTDNIGVSSYLIYRVGWPDATHGNPIIRDIAGTSVTTVPHPGWTVPYLFESGKTYTFNVVAYDASGNGSPSGSVSVTIP